jgi:hypothetical protein
MRLSRDWRPRDEEKVHGDSTERHKMHKNENSTPDDLTEATTLDYFVLLIAIQNAQNAQNARRPAH